MQEVIRNSAETVYVCSAKMVMHDRARYPDPLEQLLRVSEASTQIYLQ